MEPMYKGNLYLLEMFYSLVDPESRNQILSTRMKRHLRSTEKFRSLTVSL